MCPESPQQNTQRGVGWNRLVLLSLSLLGGMVISSFLQFYSCSSMEKQEEKRKRGKEERKMFSLFLCRADAQEQNGLNLSQLGQNGPLGIEFFLSCL